jgi:thiamine biosynthesis lipoprotein
VLVDREVLGILLECRTAWQRTAGYFDAAAGRGTFAAVAIDPEERTVRFDRPGVAIDLGGIGKGYAIDRGAAIIAAQGVTSALLHGGTSSVRASGCDAMGCPWSVAVRDPFAPPAEAVELFRIELQDHALSCSATRAAGQTVSDVVDPLCGEPLEGHAACVVLACDAAQAEVLSTALLCMGKAMAADVLARYGEWGKLHVAWVESPHDRPVWGWLA